jgi:hypothetical protein
VPGTVQSQVVWYEIGAFRGATCAALGPQLAGGIPLDGASARLAWKKADKTPPPLGDLRKDKYAFGAVARKEDCSILGSGCAEVDVDDKDTVDVAIKSVGEPRGACITGSICQGARCVPANDDNDPSIGAGCSLQLVGTGPLGNPLGVARTRVSSPAVVATKTGFLVAYREVDSNLSRVSVIPIDNGGGALPAKRSTLSERCEAVDPDATGLASDGQKATLAIAQMCGTKGGVFVRRLNEAGEKDEGSLDTFNTSGNDTATLAPSHSLAFKPNGRAVLVFTQSEYSGVAEFTDTAVSFTQFPPFGGAPPQTAAWVGATDQMVALLSLGSGAASGDGGAEAGTTGESTLRLQMVAGNADFNSLPPPFEFKATWGALGVNGKLAAIAYDGSSANKPVAWRIYELGNGQPLFQDGFTTEGGVKVSYADVAFLGDRMFFAVERGGAVNPQTDTVTVEGTVSLVAFDRATKAPLLVRTVNLSKDPRIPALKRVRDGLIAVSASESRVIVVWVNARELLPNDIVGGYALFACTP